jgi:hypothetical protein
MSDTTRADDAAFLALCAGRSATDRLKTACGMFDAAKALIAADLRAKDPRISPADLRLRMFERLYFGDFDEPTRARFIAALRADH